MKKFFIAIGSIIAILAVLILIGGSYFAKQFNQMLKNGGFVVEWNTTDGEILKDLSYGESYRNTYDLYLPANKSPKALMLFIHGGSWNSGNKEDMAWAAQRYAKEGYVTASINYSRLGADSIVVADKVTKTSLESMLKEINTSIAAIKTKCGELGCQLEQMAIGGYSAGGHLAMLYASRYTEQSAIPIKFQISWVGPSNFNLLFATPDIKRPIEGPHAEQVNKLIKEMSNFMYALSGEEISLEELTKDRVIAIKSKVSPVDVAHAATPPAVLAYGGKDRLVNAEHGSQMANKLKELGIDQHLIIFPESGHELGRDPECTDSLQRVILDYCEKYFD